jgi:uncharacterized protein (DUF305 family)
MTIPASSLVRQWGFVRLRTACSGALAILTAAACASTPPAVAPQRGMAADSIAALEALYRERAGEARSRYTQADVRFMTDMIGHHEQAVIMANLARTRAGGPAVQTLAARIRNGQLSEIELMQQWLRDRGLPVPAVDAAATSLTDHTGHAGHHAHAAMPGMLTAAQMLELEQASGTDFDRLFLIRMIEHHRGAVVMVDALLEADGAAQDPAVFRLASDVHTDQTTEIARMQRLLATLLGGRDPQH